MSSLHIMSETDSIDSSFIFHFRPHRIVSSAAIIKATDCHLKRNLPVEHFDAQLSHRL